MSDKPKVVINGTRPSRIGIDVYTFVCTSCNTGDLKKVKGLVGYKMMQHLEEVHKLSHAEAVYLVNFAPRRNKRHNL